MHQLQGLIEMFLQPGDLFVADSNYQMRTILGSCVSITLWHPATRMGGMSHFLLPSRGGAAASSPALDGRYGDEALQQMIYELRQFGVPAAQCQAKLFGGGNMFPQTPTDLIPVGQRNGEAAREMLQKAGIPLVSESLFGAGHRQIIFNVRNGDVWAQQVRPTSVTLAEKP
jgi:chemotaxis protein CheD